MKKSVMLVLSIFLAFLTIGCSLNSSKNNTDKGDGQREISIIAHFTNEDELYKSFPELARYIMKFEAEKGIKVNFEKINFSNYDDYIQKLNTKLYMKEGPTLVFFSTAENYGKYIDAGIALNIKGKIPNYDKVYDSLKYKDSFVPVGMSYISTVLNKSALDELDMEEPNIDWTHEEYSRIKEQWIKHKEQVNFSYIVYRDIVERPLNDLEIIDKEKKVIYLNTSEIKDLINIAREKLFSGSYIINQQYSYMDYYNAFFDYNTNEHLKTKEFDFWNDNNMLERRFGVRALKSFVTSSYIEKENVLILPRLDVDTALSTSGFIINRNGKNTDLAIDFLNGLLDDEVQLSMFNNLTYGGYPVNKDIEEKISKIELDNDVNKDAIILRKYILEKIKAGELKPYKQIDSTLYEFRQMLHKDLMKLIFSKEEYSDEELSKELQKLEDKYNMWLKE